MLNENVVTMNLDDYTKIIIENNDLKKMLLGIKKKVKREVQNKIYEQRIVNIKSKDEVLKLLDSDEKTLLSKFTDNYNWSWTDISEINFDVVNPTEVREMAVSEIKFLLNERLGDLPDNEEKENA